MGHSVQRRQSLLSIPSEKISCGKQVPETGWQNSVQHCPFDEQTSPFARHPSGPQTIDESFRAVARLFVVGSAIFDEPDYRAAIEELERRPVAKA